MTDPHGGMHAHSEPRAHGEPRAHDPRAHDSRAQDAEPRGSAARPAERRVLDGLIGELDRDLALVARLADVARVAPALVDFAADARTQLERSRVAAVVTLVGSTGAGKSTLLNALAGQRIAQEGEDRPTTSAPVVYRPRDADLGDLLDGLPGAAPRIVDYDPAPSDQDTRGASGGAAWSGQVLIDAPDTNSVETLHREVVGALAARSDVLVIVTHRQSIAELSSARFVDAFSGRRGMLFVLNRIDELTPSNRAALVAQLRELAAGRFRAPDAPVLAVSARDAQGDPNQPEWRALLHELHALATSDAVGGVRRRNALGAVASLAELTRSVEPAALDALNALEAATREGAAGWRQDVEAAVQERLAHRANDLAAMLWNDAAKAWDGPGGYALRAGGLATLGLGTGAALARSNPALAAGAAVGALVVDRARGALRERGFHSTSGLLPGSGELERWQRDRFSGARLCAEDAFAPDSGGEADGRHGDARHRAAGVPNPGALVELTGRAVEDAWEQLVSVDLPAAARATLPRAVPWLVDLPVYALGAWIVYRAAVGLFVGTYVGFEFLGTAAIVALAWLFLCRSLVRRALRRRGARLLAGVRARIGERLAAEEARLVVGQARALATPREALARLAASERTWRQRLRA